MAREHLWILDDARIMGGGQFFALRLARASGNATIICPAGSALEARARSAAITVRSLAFPDPWKVPRVLLSARRLRRMVRGGVVVAGSARCQAVAVAAGFDRELIHLMHERDSAERWSVRMVQRHRGSVLALGATAAQAYGSASIRNFLLDDDFERFAAVPPAPGNGTLGVLARLIPEKGVLELVQSKPAGRLLIGGDEQDGEYAARLREAAGPGVTLLGHVADVPAFLSEIDVLIVPSTGHEAQPTVILEALAAGRPVVVREAIYSRDYDGLPVVPYGDLQDAIRRATGARVNRALVRERFGPAQALAGLGAT